METRRVSTLGAAAFATLTALDAGCHRDHDSSQPTEVSQRQLEAEISDARDLALCIVNGPYDNPAWSQWAPHDQPNEEGVFRHRTFTDTNGNKATAFERMDANRNLATQFDSGLYFDNGVDGLDDVISTQTGKALDVTYPIHVGYQEDLKKLAEACRSTALRIQKTNTTIPAQPNTTPTQPTPQSQVPQQPTPQAPMPQPQMPQTQPQPQYPTPTPEPQSGVSISVLENDLKWCFWKNEPLLAGDTAIREESIRFNSSRWGIVEVFIKQERVNGQVVEDIRVTPNVQGYERADLLQEAVKRCQEM